MESYVNVYYTTLGYSGQRCLAFGANGITDRLEFLLLTTVFGLRPRVLEATSMSFHRLCAVR